VHATHSLIEASLEASVSRGRGEADLEVLELRLGASELGLVARKLTKEASAALRALLHNGLRLRLRGLGLAPGVSAVTVDTVDTRRVEVNITMLPMSSRGRRRRRLDHHWGRGRRRRGHRSRAMVAMTATSIHSRQLSENSHLFSVEASQLAAQTPTSATAVAMRKGTMDFCLFSLNLAKAPL